MLSDREVSRTHRPGNPWVTDPHQASEGKEKSDKFLHALCLILPPQSPMPSGSAQIPSRFTVASTKFSRQCPYSCRRNLEVGRRIFSPVQTFHYPGTNFVRTSFCCITLRCSVAGATHAGASLFTVACRSVLLQPLPPPPGEIRLLHATLGFPSPLGGGQPFVLPWGFLSAPQ